MMLATSPAMTHDTSGSKDRKGNARARFAAVFPLLVIAATAFFFILMFPKETSRLLMKAVPLFKNGPALQTVAGIEPLDPLRFDGNKALDEASRFIALGPRCSGTDGAERAAGYLARRLKEIGIEPIIDEFKDMTPAGERTFRNVTGEIPGTKETQIILMSHYDTKSGISPDFAGANDSGSSSGILLEVAKLLKSTSPTGPTIFLAFMDGEECMKEYGPHDGLHGSKRLAMTIVQNKRARNVIAVILLDMVGDKDLSIEIPRNSSPKLVSLVFAAATEENARLKFALSGGNVLDDHVPFMQAGMQAIDIIDFDYGSAPGRNDYWHTADDTIDKLSANSLETIGRIVVRTLNKLRVDQSR